MESKIARTMKQEAQTMGSSQSENYVVAKKSLCLWTKIRNRNGMTHTMTALNMLNIAENGVKEEYT